MIGEPFGPEHEQLRRTVRRFAQTELAPHAREWDEAGEFPREVFRRAGELGLLGITFGVEHGGMGLDWWFVAALCEELVHSRNAGVNMALLVQCEIATPIIDALGSEEQKRLFLEPAIRGERIAALAVSEPGCGSDVASLTTRARRDGDDYVIDGAKMWITNGTRADFLTLAVRTGGPGHAGVTLLTFPTDTRGFSVSKKLEKVGNLSSDTALLYFDGCRVPRRFLLGEEGQGFQQIMINFQGERLAAALLAVAEMQQMIDDALRYGGERHAFGRPVARFQVWRHRFAEHLAAVEAARRLCYRACDLLVRREDAVREISMAKLFAGDLAQRVAYDCMQLHGGMGYIVETDIARTWRDVRLLTIGGGTSEIMKEIVARTSGF